MMKLLAAVFAIVTTAALSRAASMTGAPPPTMERPLSRPAERLNAPAEDLKDERRSKILSLTEDLKSADTDVKSLLQAVVKLNGFDIWQRTRTHLQSPPADPDFANDIRRFSYYFKDFSQKCRQIELKLQKLSEAVLKNSALLPLAEQLAQHATDLREQTIWLETQARDGAADLRSAGFSAEAFEFQQTGTAGADSARLLDAHAGAILQQVR